MLVAAAMTLKELKLIAPFFFASIFHVFNAQNIRFVQMETVKLLDLLLTWNDA